MSKRKNKQNVFIKENIKSKGKNKNVKIKK